MHITARPRHRSSITIPIALVAACGARELQVYAVLAAAPQEQDGSIRMTRAAFRDAAGLSDDTITTCLWSLRARGYVTWERADGEQGRPYRYELHPKGDAGDGQK